MDEGLHDVSTITNLAKGFRKMAIPEKVGLGRGSGGRMMAAAAEADCGDGGGGDTTDIQSVGSMNTCAGDDPQPSQRKYGGKIGLGRGYSALRRPGAAAPGRVVRPFLTLKVYVNKASNALLLRLQTLFLHL